MAKLSVTRIALGVEYNGRLYKGWQSQKSPDIPTVQDDLEAALSKVANHPVKLVCAGRTDTGVHASAQVVHFESNSDRSEKAWLRGANSLLPYGVSVRWAQQVNEEFHARFSALGRHYRYFIYNSPVRPAILNGLVSECFQVLDESLMHEAAQHLLGTHDFTSYRGVACQAKSPIRTVKALSVKRYGDFVVIDIRANAFLLHMVRNVAGVLMDIGVGRKAVDWSAEVLALKDRNHGGITASPSGLYFVGVDYPGHFQLPDNQPGPAFFQLLQTD